MARRVRKRHEDATAKLLLPSFRAAIHEDQVKAFLDRAALIWFLQFPEPEEDVYVHQPFVDDTGYDDYIRHERLKVGTMLLLDECASDGFFKVLKNRLYWLAGFFPKNIRDGPVPEDSVWMEEMNKGVKVIVSSLCTHKDTSGLAGIELCLEDNLGLAKERAALEAQERLDEEYTMLHF